LWPQQRSCLKRKSLGLLGGGIGKKELLRRKGTSFQSRREFVKRKGESKSLRKRENGGRHPRKKMTERKKHEEGGRLKTVPTGKSYLKEKSMRGEPSPRKGMPVGEGGIGRQSRMN